MNTQELQLAILVARQRVKDCEDELSCIEEETRHAEESMSVAYEELDRLMEME